MFTIINNGHEAVIITASNRKELNSKTNEVEHKIWAKYGDCEYNESRVYEDEKPDLKRLKQVDLKDFNPFD